MSTTAVIDALLRSSDPSIRWKTRVHVLGEDGDSRKNRPLREEIRGSPTVRALLSRRLQLGRPGSARSVYYHWQGLHWVVASLADLGYPEGDESLHPIRDRLLEFWLGPSYFREFVARTERDAYAQCGVPLMRGRYRRCASQQGNVMYSLTTLGISDERADSLVERLLHWQWPDGGWNCDRKPAADTSSFMETLLPMLGLAAYARRTKHAAAAKGGETGVGGLPAPGTLPPGLRRAGHPPGLCCAPLSAVLALRLPRRAEGDDPAWPDQRSALRRRSRRTRDQAPARRRLARGEAPPQADRANAAGVRRLRGLGRY